MDTMLTSCGDAFAFCVTPDQDHHHRRRPRHLFVEEVGEDMKSTLRAAKRLISTGVSGSEGGNIDASFIADAAAVAGVGKRF